MHDTNISAKAKVRLVPDMLTRISHVYNTVDPIHIDFDFVKQYEVLIPDDGQVDLFNLPSIGTKFLYIHDICKDCAVVATAIAAFAKSKVDAESAHALLDRSSPYFASIEIKPTEKTREAFVDQDQLYMAAVHRHQHWKAVADYFEKTRSSFETWHNWAKKLLDVDVKTLPNAGKPRSE